MTSLPHRLATPLPGLDSRASCCRLPDRVVMGVARRLEPARHRQLLPRVVLDPLDPLDVQRAEEGVVPSGEGEPGDGGRDADVDPDHPRVEPVLELAGRPAAPGEDRCTVAVWAGAADGEGLV